MLEARTALAESKLEDSSKTNLQLEGEMARLREAYDNQTNKLKDAQTQIKADEKVKTELANLRAEVEIMVEEKKQLMKQLTEANVQKGVLQAKLNTAVATPSTTQKKS
jgi:uncharacterized coiled-coil protein SlyX